MQSIAPGHANLNGSAERHEIGRNGSFWMPEKTGFTKSSVPNKSSKDSSSARNALRDLGPKVSSSDNGPRSVSNEFSLSKKIFPKKPKTTHSSMEGVTLLPRLFLLLHQKARAVI